MGPTKFIWDLHDLVGPMWILTNQRECVEKCVLEGVLLAFLFYLLHEINRWSSIINMIIGTVLLI